MGNCYTKMNFGKVPIVEAEEEVDYVTIHYHSPARRGISAREFTEINKTPKGKLTLSNLDSITTETDSSSKLEEDFLASPPASTLELDSSLPPTLELDSSLPPTLELESSGSKTDSDMPPLIEDFSTDNVV